jgi:phage gp46-like protein
LVLVQNVVLAAEEGWQGDPLQRHQCGSVLLVLRLERGLRVLWQLEQMAEQAGWLQSDQDSHQRGVPQTDSLRFDWSHNRPLTARKYHG